MASGTIRKSIKGREYFIEWSSTENVANNTSTVTCVHKLKNDSTYSLYISSRDNSCTVDGTKKEFTSNAISTGGGSTITLGTTTHTVKHNADGTKKVTITGVFNVKATLSGTYYSSLTASETVTLDTIGRKATITAAPNFNDESNPKITYTNPAASAASSLQAAIYGSNGTTVYAAYRDISKTGTSYTFNLTDAERNALRNAIPNSKSMTVRFYVRTVIGGNTYTSYLSKTFSLTNAAPTVNPTIKDTNTVTVALTGDSNKLVRYYSNAAVTIGAAALKGASIKSQKAANGSKSITAASGTLSKVESGKFVFTVTDSRGYSTSKTVNQTMINYVKLSCTINNNKIDTNGNLNFTVKGNYFNSTFGAVANTLNVYYRYKGTGSFTEWAAMTVTKSGNTYTAAAAITGLDYQQVYTFEAYAVDKLATVYSDAKQVKSVPVFDWSETDFNFNVPVNLTNNNNSYSLLGLLYAMTTTYEITPEVTVGSNYNSVTATAHLIGGNLRIGISAERKEAVNVGNVTNETICTLLINHGGKINNLYRVSFNSSTEGGAATFDAQASKVDDNTVRVTINLCATTTAATGWNAYFAMPCSIKTKAYV